MSVRYRILGIAFSLICLCGLVGAVWLDQTPPRVTAPLPEAAAKYSDPITPSSNTGDLEVQVVWRGTVPTPDIIGGLIPTPSGSRWTFVPNPFIPTIDPLTRGIENVVISLSGVDPRISKAWSRGPVEAQFHKSQLTLIQDGKPGTVAFSRLGEALTLRNRDDEFHSLRARGSAFFTYPLPPGHDPFLKTFDKPGRVDLSSGAGYFWCGATLMVCDHPYFGVTDRTGACTITQVPPGEVQVEAWLRPWEITGRDRDPETGRLIRLHFREGHVVRGTAQMKPGHKTVLKLTYGTGG